MDAETFDRIARSLMQGRTRRGVLRRLAQLPLAAGLAALLADGLGAALATDDDRGSSHRRHRRKARHRHRTGKNKEHGKGQRKGKRQRKDKGKGTGTDTTPITCSRRTCPPNACGSQSDGCGGTLTCGGCAGNTICDGGVCQPCDVCRPAGSCAYDSVQAAINGRPAGSTIRICAGSFGPITIKKNLTLIGAGDGSDASNTILDAAQQTRVVDISTGVAVTLQGLRVTGGKVTDSEGAGILNDGNLTMTDCTVTANHAVPGGVGFGYGAGIDNLPSANLTMTNCTISHNSAKVEAGGINLLEGTHTLTNCIFTGNTAGVRGGAIKFNNGGTTTLVGCTIGPDNDAPDGALVVWNDCQVTIDATTVSGNTGTTAGGINNEGGVVTLQNGSTVSGNSPNNCVGTITGPGCAA